MDKELEPLLETEQITGYCKVHNRTREMNFVYKVENGERYLSQGDCDFDSCKYSGECYVMRQAFALEED